MSGFVGLGIQPLDLGRTLAQAESIRGSRLAQLAQQREIEQADALSAAMPGVAEGLTGADPAARQSALRTLLGLGSRGMSLALPMIERDAAPPQTRNRNVGSQVIDEEYDRATRTWRQIGSAPRWAPQAPRTTYTDVTDAEGNIVGQRTNAGQYIPVAGQGGNMFGGGEGGLALQFLTRNAERFATGQMTPDQERQYEAALSVVQRPRVSLDPATGTMTTITPQLPDFIARAVDARRGGGQGGGPPAGAPEASVLPPAALAMPAPGGAPAPAAGSPQADAPQQVAPGVTQQQVAPARITPQAREAVRKMEVETRRVTDAMDQYERVLAETGGPGFNTLINNPRDPQAQRLLGAYNNLVTALRSEAFLNTGVLQPAEMGMIERMLLAPDSLRGAAASPEAIRARLGEIRTFLDGGVNRVRDSAGLPREDAPQRAAPATGAPPTMRWNPETQRVEPIR